MNEKKSIERELGRHDATLEHHTEDITDLRGQLDKLKEQIRKDMASFKTVEQKLKDQTNKTLWTRRGGFGVIMLIFAGYLWFVASDKEFAKEIILWLFHASHHQ